MSETDSVIQKRVAEQIASRGGGIRNMAALGALVKIIPGLGGGLHHALTAGDAAIADAKAQIQLDLLCELVEKIDAALSEIVEDAQARGVPFVEIAGTINVTGQDAKDITGLDASGGRAVSVKPGTIINVGGKGVTNITGVKV